VQGKIVEDWVLVESLGFFQQLGVVPETADLVGKTDGTVPADVGNHR